MNAIRKIIKGKEKQKEQDIINALDYLIRQQIPLWLT
jgi:hypothetical protein